MKKQIAVLFISAISLFGACSRVEQPVLPATDTLNPASSSQVILPREEQEKRAFVLFEEILAVVQEASGEENFAKIEQLYLELIYTCPDIGLAQESAWRLLIKYHEQGSPEYLAKAKVLYDYFIKRYPKSIFRDLMDKKMTGAAKPTKTK